MRDHLRLLLWCSSIERQELEFVWAGYTFACRKKRYQGSTSIRLLLINLTTYLCTYDTSFIFTCTNFCQLSYWISTFFGALSHSLLFPFVFLLPSYFLCRRLTRLDNHHIFLLTASTLDLTSWSESPALAFT